MNRLIQLQKILFATLVATVAGTSAMAQTVGGNLDFENFRSEDIEFAGIEVRITGDIEGPVEGAGINVYMDANVERGAELAGVRVTINGSIGGNLETGGVDVEVNSEIAGDVEAGGVNLEMNGRFLSNVHVEGVNIGFSENSFVGGDFIAEGRDVELRGLIEGQATLKAETLRLAGQFNGDVDVEAETVIIEDSAVFTGNLTIRAENEPEIAEGASLGGEYSYEYMDFESDFDDWEKWENFEDAFDFDPPAGLVGGIFGFTAFILGMLFILIAPNSTPSIVTAFKRKPAIAIVLGIVMLPVTMILIPTLAFVLLFTIIGIPISLIMFFLMPFFYILSYALGAIIIGDLIFNRSGETMGMGMRTLSFFAVLLIVGALSAMAQVGILLYFMVWPIILIMGLGAWTLAVFSRSSTTSEASGDAV